MSRDSAFETIGAVSEFTYSAMRCMQSLYTKKGLLMLAARYRIMQMHIDYVSPSRELAYMMSYAKRVGGTWEHWPTTESHLFGKKSLLGEVERQLDEALFTQLVGQVGGGYTAVKAVRAYLRKIISGIIPYTTIHC